MMNILSVSKLLHYKLILAILIGIGFAATAVPAYAHFIYEDGFTYASDFDCAANRAEISHGSGGGYSRSDIAAWVIGGDEPCRDHFIRPAGYLRAASDLDKWSGSSWQPCVVSNWTYSTKSAHTLQVATDYGSNPPCGSGIYRTYGDGQFLNGTWKGGGLSSGGTGHTLPPP